MGAQQGNDDQLWQSMPSLLAAAHELKSPLVLIRQLSLQLEESPDSVSLERIGLTAERSLRLVEGLTRSSRLEDTLFECEPISIQAFYEDVLHEVTPLAHALSQKIELDMPRRHLTVVANQTLLRSIILGLCDNALTHNDATKPVRLSARKQNGRVVTHVRDFGPYSPTLQKINSQIGKGTFPVGARPRSSGLGLMIARQFADHMNADLSLTRHRGGGSTFSVSLIESRQISLMEMLS